MKFPKNPSENWINFRLEFSGANLLTLFLLCSSHLVNLSYHQRNIYRNIVNWVNYLEIKTIYNQLINDNWITNIDDYKVILRNLILLANNETIRWILQLINNLFLINSSRNRRIRKICDKSKFLKINNMLRRYLLIPSYSKKKMTQHRNGQYFAWE